MDYLGLNTYIYGLFLIIMNYLNLLYFSEILKENSQLKKEDTRIWIESKTELNQKLSNNESANGGCCNLYYAHTHMHNCADTKLNLYNDRILYYYIW